MSFKAQIPNLFTLSNLLCGTIATYFAFNFDLYFAAWFILAGAFFDFFDGLIARALVVTDELGKQLDSLADLISFGMAPATIAFILLGRAGSPETGIYFLDIIIRFFPFIIVAFSAYRLAKFNIDTRQTENFIGMPTPANALFWLSLPLIEVYSSSNLTPGQIEAFILDIIYDPWFVLIASLLTSILLIVELPLFSFKFKKYSWSGNEYRFILIAISILLVWGFAFVAIPFIILLYLLLSFIKNISDKKYGIQS